MLAASGEPLRLARSLHQAIHFHFTTQLNSTQLTNLLNPMLIWVVLIIVPMLFGLYAQTKIRSAYNKNVRIE